MYSDSKNLPGHSRVWIYQSGRKLNPEEEKAIIELGVQFVNNWTAHNRELLGSFEIRHHLFLIFMIDQNHAGASGCSIDKSVHFIQQIEKQFNLSLLDRMIFAYKNDGEIQLVKMNEFNSLLSQGKINSDTIVYNNLVDTKTDLENNWEIPLSKSWHSQLAR